MKKTVITLLILILMAQTAPLPAAASGPFADVRPTDWFYNDVMFAAERQIFRGTTATTFEPRKLLTRAMLITALWRYDGAPGSRAEVPFRDIRKDAYYYPALRWAYENRIITGVSSAAFAPDGKISRNQLITIVYRYVRRRGNAAPVGFDTDVYPDAHKVASYADDAFRWGLSNHLLTGIPTDGILRLGPAGGATRAQTAAVLRRLDQLLTDGKPPEAELPEARTKTEADRTYTVWLNGKKYEGEPIWDNQSYVRLRDVADSYDGGFFSVGDNIRLEAYAYNAYISRSQNSAVLNGVPVRLRSACVFWGDECCIPTELLTKICMKELIDDDFRQVFYTYITQNAQVESGHRVAILRYHAVSDDTNGEEQLYMSPQMLEQQIRSMKAFGCTFLTFDELKYVHKYKHPVMLTFDDGYRDNYTELFPILKKYQVKATIFMITDYIGLETCLTADQIREMAASGLVSFQSHTTGHHALKERTEEQYYEDLVGSQLALARLTGKVPYALSYPRGIISDRALKQIRQYYEFGVLADNGPCITGGDPYKMSRYQMRRDITLEELMARFSQ